MLYYALAVWTVVHTVVYFKYIEAICGFAVYTFCNAPSLKGLPERGYNGQRLKAARAARLKAASAADTSVNLVYYLTKGAYMALGSVVGYILCQVL